jgi:hypothetical protein
VGLWWLVNAYSNHSIHNAKEVSPQSTKGSFPGMQVGQFPECKVMVLQASGDHGGGHVALRTITTWALGPLPNYSVMVLGNEGGGSSSYARLLYTRPMDWFKKASSFDFEHAIETKNIFSFLIPMFSPKTNMNIYFVYQPHSHMYVQ